MGNPTFQHRHYKAVAAWLAQDVRARLSPEDFVHVVTTLAKLFNRDNQRFDASRFFAAADGNPKWRDRL